MSLLTFSHHDFGYFHFNSLILLHVKFYNFLTRVNCPEKRSNAGLCEQGDGKSSTVKTAGFLSTKNNLSAF
jgi:hypothetical protein